MYDETLKWRSLSISVVVAALCLLSVPIGSSYACGSNFHLYGGKSEYIVVVSKNGTPQRIDEAIGAIERVFHHEIQRKFTHAVKGFTVRASENIMMEFARDHASLLYVEKNGCVSVQGG